MEQFRQIGEVLGGLKALMVFRDNIQINPRQCCLLLDVFSFAYDSISEEMRQNLKFEEKNVKWRILEPPLREIYRIFKEGEGYIRQCLEIKDWWAKAITLYQNSYCVEFYIHNLLSCIPVVIESIEIAGEFSGLDQDEIQKKRLVYSNKYQKEWKDPRLFQWKFAKQYLISQELCNRYDTVWKEDRWLLLNKILEKKMSGSTKQERQLTDILLKNLEGSEPVNGKLLPCSILVRSKDYSVRRRLGSGSQYKEILWLGESLALRHFFGDIEPLFPEISSLLSLSHPNILQFLCGFTDEEKKECFLVMELMTRDLCSYIRETCGPRKRIPFSLPIAVDLMEIYHGNLNPSNILVKPRNINSEGYLHAKVSGFGLSSIKNFTPKNSSNQNETLSFIWHAPEILEEKEQTGSGKNSKYTEKLMFPFEDSHLQGDNMSRNILAGERPLFPFYSPKYVTNLTKRCWHTDPNQRPSFSSICRILRYVKRFLIMNPDYNREPEPPMPVIDYGDMETKLLRKFPSWDTAESSMVAQIPFQMFVYRVVEKEKARTAQKETSESGSDKASFSGDENSVILDDPCPSPSCPSPTERRLSITGTMTRRPSISKRLSDVKTIKQSGTPKGRSRPPQLQCTRSLRTGSESQLMMMSPRSRRTSSGHASDSEIS
ncbi:mitogen-activated protein kinase kinase kinase [Salix suchowensis]|nr:mitogen-activated protein kinase kinase kinase [Salix suchowensis]